jgi:hypothetical protein
METTSKTPLCDAAAYELTGSRVPMETLARKLETDRAALIAALELAENFCEMGLNSAESKHWEAALDDILGAVRATLAAVQS